MNHQKFIQLLNLYIDGEATPPEAREVELEIENNPARRRIYDDYRRIQDATRALYAPFRRDGDSTPTILTVAGAAGRIRAAGVRSAAATTRPGRVSGHPFRRVLFWAGGAAAACLAVGVAFWSMPRFGGAPTVAEAADSPGVSVPVIEAPATAIASAQQPSTYTAPFTAAPRVDPFVVGNTLPPGDPFSLTSASRQNPFGDPELKLDFPAGLTTAVSQSGDAAAEAERIRKLKTILRRENQPPQNQVVPVNLRQQP